MSPVVATANPDWTAGRSTIRSTQALRYNIKSTNPLRCHHIIAYLNSRPFTEIDIQKMRFSTSENPGKRFHISQNEPSTSWTCQVIAVSKSDFEHAEQTFGFVQITFLGVGSRVSSSNQNSQYFTSRIRASQATYMSSGAHLMKWRAG